MDWCTIPECTQPADAGVCEAHRAAAERFAPTETGPLPAERLLVTV